MTTAALRNVAPEDDVTAGIAASAAVADMMEDAEEEQPEHDAEAEEVD